MSLVNIVAQMAPILNRVHDGIAIVDEHGFVVYVNDANERITGWRAADIVGKHFKDVVPDSHFAQVIASRESLVNVRTKVAAGEVLSNISPIVYEDVFVGVISVFRDTSELLRVADQLSMAQQTIAELQQQLQADVIPFVVGSSREMSLAVEKAWRVRNVSSTVLITGESGTGKELMARYIHASGARREAPFVAVNCAAVPESLFESELFGYAEGAFTGGKRGGQKGLIESADGGTLFLDEVAELPLSMQSKLLRFLQFSEIRKVGSFETQVVDVRIVAATNRDLATLIREGAFRKDLYYRLRVIDIPLPPLRHRLQDMPLLVHDLLRSICGRLRMGMKQPADDFLQRLSQYDFPGNVRELENLLEQAVVMARESMLTADLLTIDRGQVVSADMRTDSPMMENDAYPQSDQLGTLAYLEREQIMQAVRNHKTLLQAAGALGISRTTLYRKMKQYHIHYET